jgi:hypothetical protein
MGNKVTKETLINLIEGVLNEKITNNLLTTPEELYSTKTNDKPKDSNKNKQNWSNVGVGRSDKTIQNYYDNFQALASMETPEDTIDFSDLESVISDMIDAELKGEKAPKKNSRKLKMQSAIATMKNSGSDEIKSAIKKAFSRKMGEKQIEPAVAEKIGSKIENYFQELAFQDVNAFGSQEMPFKTLETSKSDFQSNQKIKQVSPFLLDLFGSIGGDTIISKLNSIAEFSNAAEKNELEKWAAGKDEFAPFTYSKVLVFLADEIKKLGTKEAGTLFERWLALLLNFPVIGAEGGAADNIGKTAKGTIYTSAKLYSTPIGEYAPFQSTASLFKETQGGEKIYYLVAIKNKGDQKKAEGFSFIRYVDLYLIEIKQDLPNVYEGSFIFDNGNKTSNSWELGQKSNTQSYIFPPNITDIDAIEGYKLLTIYLPNGKIDENVLETTAKFLSDKVATITNQPVTQAILKAATNIKKLEANTDSYAGKSQKAKGSATSYIQKITDDYKELRGLYDIIFTHGEGKTTTIAESKKITANHLKKIIEESLKKNK